MTKHDSGKQSMKRIHVTVPELPEYEGTKHTIISNRIIFVEAVLDQDCTNPCEDCDGFGSIRSLSSRHINCIEIDEATELLNTDPDVIPLSYYEHGNCLWMVQNSPAPAGVEFQWDGARFAGVWVPDQCVRESYTGQDGLTRREWMVKQAACACETYSQWANGECYGYSVQVFKVRKDSDGEPFNTLSDYRRDRPEYEDSCFGFIGWEYFKQEMLEQAVHALKSMYKNMRFSSRAISAAFKNIEHKEE